MREQGDARQYHAITGGELNWIKNDAGETGTGCIFGIGHGFGIWIKSSS